MGREKLGVAAAGITFVMEGMSSLRDKRTGAGQRGLAVVVLAVIALLAASSSAFAGPDDLKGGSVLMQLKGSRGLKLKPGSLTLTITGGAIDPVDGSGTAQISGGFKARRGKGKTKVKIVNLTLGANGGQGSIVAKVGKNLVSGFGTLHGGTVTRDGWGAKIENVSATIAGRGAKALNGAFSPRKGKGARKSAGGRVKAGQPLGKIVSMTTIPLAVGVVPGTGSMILRTAAMGAFVSKLPKHCIDPLPTGSPAGVTPVAPATTLDPPVNTVYSFPVTGGAIAPDFTAGELLTGGGQTITKNSSLLNPGACGSAQPSVGAQLVSKDFGVAFNPDLLKAVATLPTGTTLPRAPLADIDFSTSTRSVDASTKTVSVIGATVKLAALAAPLLNQAFPTESGSAGDDFATGDAIGTIDITGVKLR
jgi:hypothetical protein